MTPELTAASPGEASKQIPSTAGMTTKVVKGSMWTLAGQVAPLLVSLVTTPFVIRMLGAEGYGVFILIGLIPTYLAFADFGMSMASTKFASEAYAEGDTEKEARIVRTAALIATLTSLPMAATIVATSNWIVGMLNVPESLRAEATLALKFAAATFLVNFLNAIFNTPQLARLRMDLNTLVTSGLRVAGIIATPIVIYLGGGILGAVVVLMVASLLTFVGHLYVSSHLLPSLLALAIDRSIVRPLIRFGVPLVFSAVAAVILTNVEKLVLARLTTVQELAYYSVAFMLVSIAPMFAAAMVQSLVPAFSQLLGEKRREQMLMLFNRAVRINVIVAVPLLVTLFVLARPFFTLWAGPEFGLNSTSSFYILSVGVVFNIVSYIPTTLLMAAGRSDIYAKIFWIELAPYIAILILLTSNFGATGAASAWSLRVILDTLLVSFFAKRIGGVSFQLMKRFSSAYVLITLLLLLFLPLTAAVLIPDIRISLILLLLGLSGYSFLAWTRFLTKEERVWFLSRVDPRREKKGGGLPCLARD